MSIFISISKRITSAIAICMIAPIYSLAFTINLDSATGNYMITYQSEMLGREVQVVFEPPTKIKPAVTPDIRFDGKFIYSYSLINASSARQDLVVFRLPIVSTPTVVQNPSGWTSLGPTPVNRIITWVSEDDTIKPDSQLSGFSIQTSDLPGIVALKFEGLADPLAYPDEPPADAGYAGLALQREDRNSFVTLFSVGPSTFVYSDPGLAIDRLVAFKHESVSRGWIFGPGSEGIVKSLDAKLDAAKAAVARGQNSAAKNQLNSFINELTAQRNKKLNDTAFMLLKTNAEFIIGKLGP